MAKCGIETKLASGLGELLWRHFLEAIVSVLEVVCARPEMLATYASILIPNSFPLLVHVLGPASKSFRFLLCSIYEANKVTDKQSGSKLLYIKLINDILEVVIEQREHGDKLELILSDDKKISLVDEIPSLLLNEAPLPVFSLRLFYQLIMASYDQFW